jgi:hypothetical protein
MNALNERQKKNMHKTSFSFLLAAHPKRKKKEEKKRTHSDDKKQETSIVGYS